MESDHKANLDGCFSVQSLTNLIEHPYEHVSVFVCDVRRDNTLVAAIWCHSQYNTIDISDTSLQNISLLICFCHFSCHQSYI